MKRLRSTILPAAIAILLAGGMAQAQIPTRAAAERLLRENPELARQRLLESGMSQAEIRAQLTAAGLSQETDGAATDGPVGSSAPTRYADCHGNHQDAIQCS